MYHAMCTNLAQSSLRGRPCQSSNTAPSVTNLYALFRTAVTIRPSAVAIEMSGSAITYEALHDKVNCCAAGFLALGVEPGDVIVFSMEKSLSLITGLLAAIKIGAKICILPETISALRLRAICLAMPVAVFVSAAGTLPGAENDLRRVIAFSIVFTSFEQLMLLGRSGSSSSRQYLSAKTAQIVISYHEAKGIFPIEFEQSAFLKVLSQLDEMLTVCQPGQRMLTATEVTKPRFLLELFYAFSRHLTCVIVEGVDRWSSEPQFAAHVLSLRAAVICLNHRSWACIVNLLQKESSNLLEEVAAWIVLDSIAVSDAVSVVEQLAKEVCAYSDLLEMAICSGLSSRAARLHWRCLSSSPLENTLKLPILGAARLFLEEYVLLNAYSQEVEVQGFRVTLGEIEYFLRQYPGVTEATAYFSVEGLVVRAHFAWNFYSMAEAQCVTFAKFSMPESDADRLASRVFYFLSQHLWAALPLKAIILQSE